MGKHIKTYENFVNEGFYKTQNKEIIGSYFHDWKDIDEILDKINKKGGYNKLSTSDKAILKNFSHKDEDVKKQLSEIKKLINKFEVLKNKLEDAAKKGASKSDVFDEIEEIKEIDEKISKLAEKLKNVYNIKDTDMIKRYLKEEV